MTIALSIALILPAASAGIVRRAPVARPVSRIAAPAAFEVLQRAAGSQALEPRALPRIRSVRASAPVPDRSREAPPMAGVWRLESFMVVAKDGAEKPWCEGAHGTIMYTESYMSVAINCSDPGKMLHYSGPYKYENGSVTHFVRNYSDPSLKKDLVRAVEFPAPGLLRLTGPLPDGGKAVASWRRL